MPDEFQIYQSDLTGPELDEALRNIGKVQQSVADAAQSAATAEQYGEIVQQNQQAIQEIHDNLTVIKAAPGNAQAAQTAATQAAASATQAAGSAVDAAQSAQAAQTAAQQALGFRTFFSAVSPDANGDLDPSRPMTTPSAQASWTVKSKGDRIQSVQANGFTEQAGTGDPSPTNVRAISTAGLRMMALVLNGTENWALRSSGSNDAQFEMPLTDAPSAGTNQTLAAQTQKCSICIVNNADNYPGDCAWAFSTGPQSRLRVRLFGATTVDALKQELSDRYAAGDPVVFWYVPADESNATGLYIPKIAQGNEYRCAMMKLTAQLCDGDKVESCVPSGCDRKFVFDGSSDEGWAVSGAKSDPTTGGKRFYCYVDGLFSASIAYANFLLLSTVDATSAMGKMVFAVGPGEQPGKTTIYLRLGSETTLEQLQTALSAAPIEMWLSSYTYTEANDTPVQLETHKKYYHIFDGTENIVGYTDLGTVARVFVNGLPTTASGYADCICAICVGLAKINNMTLSELFTRYMNGGDSNEEIPR